MINQGLLAVSQSGTVFVIFFSIIFALLSFGVVVCVNGKKGAFFLLRKSKFCKKIRNPLVFALIITFALGLVLRIILAATYGGHEDITFFNYWLNELQSKTPYNYYDDLNMNSYLPGYLYVLYALGGIIRFLGISSNYALLKLPSIICDLITAFVIFKATRKYLNGWAAYAVSTLYIFNPAVILNSSLWGQVDSFTALFSVLSLYFVSNKKFIASFVFVALGMVFKLQFAFILPVVIIYTLYVMYGAIKEKQYKELKTILYAVLIMLGVFIILVLPFTLKYMLNGDIFFIFKIYFNQTESFEYFSLNTFNIYSMLLKNWVKLPAEKLLGILSYNTLNIIIITLISVYCMTLTLLSKGKKNLFLTAALLILGVFTFVMKMHERYAYVSMAVLLLAAVISGDKRIYLSFAIFSLLQFANTGILLFSSPRYFETENAFLVVFSNLWVFFFIYFAYTVTSIVLAGRKTDKALLTGDNKAVLIGSENTISERALTEELSADTEKEEEKHKKEVQQKKETFDERYEKSIEIRKNRRLGKKDIIIIAVLFIAYFLLNMINIGSTVTPQTWWEVNKTDEYIVLQLPQDIVVGEIWAYKGIDKAENESNCIKIYVSDTFDEQNRSALFLQDNFSGKRNITNNGTNDTASMYKWFKVADINRQCPYIGVTASKGVRINEIVLLEKTSGDIIEYGIVCASSQGDNSPHMAFDEKDTYLGGNSLMTDMYFDEIYHARTAFEHINGWEPYEITHPPLGKLIISVGIRIFGMNPFGWRISGVLFSSMLLAVMYALGRELFGKRKWAILFALFSALDGLHFVQGRIATIDTYSVFFSSLAMLFMIKFFRTNILREKTVKSLLPFALSGVFFGFGVASKWTGLYTGVALLALLIIYVCRMLNEYRYTVVYIDGESKNEDKSVSVKRYSKLLDYKLVGIVLTGLIFFIILPFTVYMLSYIPYMTQEKSLSNLLRVMIENQNYMWNYHGKWVVGVTHQCQSPWYSWFINYRSVYMYSAGTGGMYARIHSMGNPILSICCIAALFFCAYKVFEKQFAALGPQKTEYKPLSAEKKDTLLFLFVGFLAAILPWVFVERATFIYHFYPSVPYLSGMLIFTLMQICKKKDTMLLKICIKGKQISVTRGRAVTYAVTALMVIMFLLLFPAYTGLPISNTLANLMFRWLNVFGAHVGL